jgi:hypothetical protein
MQLRDALSDLKEIRAQLDRTQEIRGFRSIAVGFSGILTLVGAVIQLNWQSTWSSSLSEFLLIWLFVALISLTVAVVEMCIRGSQCSTQQTWSTHKKLAAQIAPSFLVGAMMTAAVVFSVRAAWMLPGMWALVYSLGLFACTQSLPRQTVWAALYFLIGGTICLAHSFVSRELDAPQLSAWYMVLLFGGGQFLLGWILYWTLERRDG